MKFLLIAEHMRVGGSQRVLAHMACQWAADGHAVSLVSFDKDEPFFQLDERIQHIKLGLERETFSKLDAIKFNFSRIKALRAIVKSAAPDIVISFGTIPNILTLFACIGLKKPVIISERTVPWALPKESGWHKLRAWAYPKATKLVTPTQGSVKKLWELTKKSNVSVIPIPVEPEPSTGVIQRDQIICTVGSLTKDKGYDLLIKAFVQLDAPEWTLVIIGDGPERKMIQRTLKELKVQDRVKLVGLLNHKELSTVLQSTPIFALTSKFEGFGDALCLAMACGATPVAFNCPCGPAEIINDGRDGLLVDPGNVDRFKDALQMLIDDPEKTAVLGRQARQITRTLNPTSVKKKWENLVHEAIEEFRNS